MGPEMIATVLQKFGIIALVIVFFIYRDWQRSKTDVKDKDAMTLRLCSVEDYQRDKLEGLVVDNTAALADHSAAVREMSDSSKILTQTIRDRPCQRNAG